MGEHVLVVGGGMEIPGLLRDHHRDCRTSVLCQLSLLASLRDVTAHQHVVALRSDTDDTDWVAAARWIHERQAITRVAAFGERNQVQAAMVAAALHLPGHDPQTVDAVHDKARMRRVLADAGVECTRSAVVGSAAELARQLADNPGRWVVKPLDGSGSAGISVVTAPDQAERAYDRASGALHTGRAGTTEVLVEEYLHGRQISVETLSEGGEHCVVAVTGKYSDPDTLVELGHVVPADLQVEPVAAHTTQVLDALGIRDGVCHTEFVLTEDGPRVIETHLRLGGDEIPYLVRDAVGVDLVDCLVRQTLGESVLGVVRDRLDACDVTPQAIWFGAATCAGTLESIDIPELDGVRFHLDTSPGDSVVPLRDSASRLLWARTSGPDPGTALQRAYDAVAACSLVVRARLADPTGISATI